MTGLLIAATAEMAGAFVWGLRARQAVARRSPPERCADLVAGVGAGSRPAQSGSTRSPSPGATRSPAVVFRAWDGKRTGTQTAAKPAPERSDGHKPQAGAYV